MSKNVLYNLILHLPIFTQEDQKTNNRPYGGEDTHPKVV